MKKLIFVIAFFICSLPTFASDVIELQNGREYLYFSESPIKAVKSNNPSIMSAQRVSLYSGSNNQMFFLTKEVGTADVRIETENGTVMYSIEIKPYKVQPNGIFSELDTP